MTTNGMTIDSLNTVSSLTAQDEVPVWDSEESGEPTKKITAQNMANSVKSLASLPNTTEMNTAIDQSKAVAYEQIGSFNASGKHTLTKPYTNYRFIMVISSYYGGMIPNYGQWIGPVDFAVSTGELVMYSTLNGFARFRLYDNNKISVYDLGNNNYMNVYGIK